LAVHREKKEIPGYELVVAKGGLKIQESAPVPPQTAEASAPPRPDGPPKQQLDQDGYPVLPPGRGPAMKGNRDKVRWRAADETMEQLASMLGTQLGQPVTDATGLKGKYDFTLSWAVGPFGSAPQACSAEPDNGPTLLQAIQSQLGLKLEQKKIPVEFLVVDHIEKVPTENWHRRLRPNFASRPTTRSSLQAGQNAGAQAQFEAASVKRTKPMRARELHHYCNRVVEGRSSYADFGGSLQGAEGADCRTCVRQCRRGRTPGCQFPLTRLQPIYSQPFANLSA
jgi:uncharacterized protein (TIGR03435 family)